MSESTTIERCQRGDNTAFAELFENYKAPAYRYCLGLLGSKTDALDIVQESFTAAFQGIGRLDSSRGFGNWFYGILRHLCYATLRQHKRESDSEILSSIPDDRPGPESRATDNERLRIAALCLDKLTTKQREIVVLRELEGLGYQEIADRLEIPIGTVMSRLYDARKALARIAHELPSQIEEATP